MCDNPVALFALSLYRELVANALSQHSTINTTIHERIRNSSQQCQFFMLNNEGAQSSASLGQAFTEKPCFYGIKVFKLCEVHCFS
jgi:hypothetical protein